MLNQVKIRWKQALGWVLRDENKSRVKKLRDDMEKAFTEHPGSTGETYPQHLWFTIRLSSRFAYAWLVILIHGLFPFLFIRTASNEVEQVYRIMKTRIPLKRREQIDKEQPMTIHNQAGHNQAGHNQTGEARVAIVGGGFSGALTLVNLIKQARGSLHVEWFEEGESLGAGVAYGTKDPLHLLNVRADRMGAFAGKPDDFYEWLQTVEGKMQAERIWEGHAIEPETFAPRILYAQYLHHLVERSLAEAKEKGIKIRISHATVVDAHLHDAQSQQVIIATERGGLQQEMLVDAVVLATGNLPPRSFHFQTGLRVGENNYVQNIWNTPADHIFPSRVHELSADSEIVIIGTGLTMADTVLTLKSRGYKGVITAISRNGLMPAPHRQAKPYPAWDWVMAPQFAPRTVLGLMVRLREEIRRAEKQGHDWRSVVDSIRPVTQALWKQLGTREKRRFFARLLTLWNIHRHRMSPDICQELKSMQQSGALKVIAGKIYYVGSDKDGLTVAYRKRGTNRVETLRPALVINCTGPEYDIAASGHALLRNLRDRELVTVGPLRIGIEITEDGTARGKASEALFPIGTLMVGDLLECTAVPELREQAQEAAGKVVERIANLYEPFKKAGLMAAQWI